MNRVLAVMLFTFSNIVLAQAPQLKSGATVYIEPMGGFETYLTAAIVKKHVPLVVVTDKSKADYIITSNVSHKEIVQPSVVVNNSNTNVINGNATNPYLARAQQLQDQAWAEKRALGSTSTSIAIVDPRSSQIVFAYAAGKEGGNQLQRTAEECAKHLKEFIEKPRK